MSFPTIPKPLKNNKKTNKRKETDSSLANHFIIVPLSKKERASTFTSQASITLEAAVVIPLFFFAVMCLVYMLEMMAIQMTIHHALHSVGKEIAQEAYNSPMISTYGIEQRVIRNIGEERLADSMVAGGVAGMDCSHSASNWNTAVIDLSVRYELEIPVLFFRIPLVTREETLRVKGWTGYANGAEGQGQKQMVYVTDYGLVYHEDMACTYLEMSIRTIRPEDAKEQYAACEFCKRENKEGNTYYVTDYGQRYHTTLDCSRIKRNIYAVPLEEAYALGGCSKCVK